MTAGGVIPPPDERQPSHLVDIKVTFKFEDLTPTQVAELSVLMKQITDFQDRTKTPKKLAPGEVPF